MQHLYICLISWGWLAFTHPFFISLTEIRYNENSQKLEIAQKIFWDDLELSMEEYLGTHVDVLNSSNKDQLDEQFQKYLLDHQNIKVNGKEIELSIIGYEIEEEAFWFYLESAQTPFENSIEVENSILIAEHETQQNIVQIYVDGKSPKSLLLRKGHEKEILQF
ncbi:DUF6702 family protein [Algoriphagus machipongonensis]|uniref:Orphan protein n=1 Tax=Algoriphagus machipongonensis TaxID=388413 RepID=A3HU01_9BACT|nr:DUF6702 family protein [Algoriphagus machipongonensis]EAZ81623.1 hypothetical protein ALPR1_00240 [Algoriphagus machipongonensis]